MDIDAARSYAQQDTKKFIENGFNDPAYNEPVFLDDGTHTSPHSSPETWYHKKPKQRTVHQFQY